MIRQKIKILLTLFKVSELKFLNSKNFYLYISPIFKTGIKLINDKIYMFSEYVF